MSRVSLDKETLKATAQAVLLAGMSGVTAAGAITAQSGGVTVTFTTDNPNITPNGAVVIADGDSVSAANNLESLVELNAKAGTMYTDIVALRTAVNSLLSTNVFDVTLANMTTTGSTTASQLVTTTYTTDNPAITPNNAITVADGDSVTAANIHEMFVEMNAQARLIFADLGAVYGAAKKIIEGKSLHGIGALPALTSNATVVTITYTTDDPSITANGAVTIADGDSASAANMWEFAVEIKDQLQKLRADLLAVHTALDSYLDKAGAA